MSTQTPDPRQWCDDMQIKLMIAMDASWRIADTSKDPAEVAKALAKAKLCAQFAATVRKIAAMSPHKPLAKAATGPAAPASPLDEEPMTQATIARTALERFRGGRRGRL